MHGQGFPVSSCVCHIYIHPCAYDINRDHILFLLSQQGIPLHSAASLPTATRSNREMTAQRLVLRACTQLASICLVLHKLTIKLNFFTFVSSLHKHNISHCYHSCSVLHIGTCASNTTLLLPPPMFFYQKKSDC